MLAHPLNHLNYVGVNVLKIVSEEGCLLKFLKDEKKIYEEYKEFFKNKSKVESSKDYESDLPILNELLEEIKHHFVERAEMLKKLKALKENNYVKKFMKNIKTNQNKFIILLTKTSAKSYSPWKIFEGLDSMNDIFNNFVIYLDEIIKNLSNG